MEHVNAVIHTTYRSVPREDGTFAEVLDVQRIVGLFTDPERAIGEARLYQQWAEPYDIASTTHVEPLDLVTWELREDALSALELHGTLYAN